ncbi:MAG: 30S ribosome-binding factor RbfA [Pseudomonadota bacterium]
MSTRAYRSSRGPSQRQLRAGELIRHELAQMVQREEVHEAALTGRNVTVTEVTTSPDLKHATVFITTLGGHNVPETVEALQSVSPKIRGVLGRKLTMKFVPQLSFEQDQSFDRADRITQLLNGNS